MVLFELWIGGTKRLYVDLKLVWDVNYSNLPNWEAQLAYANESVNRGDAVEIKRRNAIDVSPVSIYKGLMEYKNPKMGNTGKRVMIVGGRHEGVKAWRKWNERNSDDYGYWTNYYPDKVIAFLTRPTRSAKPSKIEDKTLRRIGWGIDPKDTSSMWLCDGSSTASGYNAQNVSDRLNGIGWQSNVSNQNGQWLEIDLGSTKNIMGVRIENRKNEYWFRGYVIKTSTTGAFGGEEITVATQAYNHAMNIVESWTPANTRYIRIYGTVTTSFPAFVGEVFVYDSSGTISGISVGTLGVYLPLNCSEITENQLSSDSHVHVRHSHRYKVNDYFMLFDGTGNEVKKQITSIVGATDQINFSGTIGFAIDTTDDPWIANMDLLHSHQINIDYKRRTEVIDKIAKLCISVSNESWEWWITDAGVVNFQSQRGSDVSGSVSFDYANEIAESEHNMDNRKSVDSVLVLPRSGKDPDDQDINSSGWQGTGDYEEVVWDDEVETEEASISKALAILKQATFDVDNITITVDDNEVATGTWGIGDTVAINDTATGISGNYRVTKIMRRYNEGGEVVTIQANSKKFSITDAIFGISKDVKAGVMQQVYDEQWRRLNVTSVPEYILFYEAELLTFDPSTTDKIVDNDVHGGAYIKRTSAQITDDMMWGPGLTLNAGLYRVRFWCKVANNASSSTVATLKVYTSDGGYTESLAVAPDDFTSSDTWQGFTFLFALETEFTDIQLIISFVTGITDFSCDWAAIMVGGTDTLADIDLDFPAGAPATPTGLSAISKPLGALLDWNLNTEQDLSHYEVYKYTSDDSGSASKIAEVMGNWFFYVCDSGEYGLTRYFWVKAVDWVGNVSGFSTVSSCAMGQVSGLDIALLAVDTEHLQDDAVATAKLDDLAVSNSKIKNLTILAGKIAAGAVTTRKLTVYQVLLENPNFHIDTGALAWDQHTLQYEGTLYTIASGSTNNEWIYWDEGDSSFTTSATRPDIVTDQTLHPIAVFDDTNDRWWEVWKPTVIHGGAIVAETINAEVLATDFFLANVEMKTGATAQWADGVGGAGVIITSDGIRGKDSSGNMEWEALNTGTEAGMITAGAGSVILNTAGMVINDGKFSLKSSVSGTRIEIDSDGIRLYDGTTLEIELDALLGVLKFGVGGGSSMSANGVRLYGGDKATYRASGYDINAAEVWGYYDGADHWLRTDLPTWSGVYWLSGSTKLKFDDNGMLIGDAIATYLRPIVDSQTTLGGSSYYWLACYADNFYGDMRYTDLRLRDMGCYYCERPFDIGDELVFVVKGFDESELGPEILTVPIHRHCKANFIKKKLYNIIGKEKDGILMDR